MIRVLDFKNSKAGPRPFSSGSEGERLDFLSGVQKKNDKKVGNAVLRNRSRRIIREAFRILAPKVKKGTDLIFVARTKTAYVKSTELLLEMEKQLKFQML